MRRQLRASGGITNARQGYGIGSWVKERIRKIIPNELASVASKAAPFVAMLPGYGPLAAGVMRGVGRFDQRGSVSDALKQGIGTYAGGKLFDKGMRGLDLRGTDGSAIKSLKELPGKFMEKSSNLLKTSGTAKDILKNQLIIGGGTALVSLISQGLIDEPEQEAGESINDFMARRKISVSKQLKTYLGNTNKFRGMSEEELDTLVAQNMTEYDKDFASGSGGYNQGGRVGLANGNLVDSRMQNSLQENIRRNNAERAVNQMSKNYDFSNLSQYGIDPKRYSSTPGPMRGIPAVKGMREKIIQDIANRQQPYSLTPQKPPEPTDRLTGMREARMLPNMNPSGNMMSLTEANVIRDRVLAAQQAQAPNKPSYQERLMGEDWNMLSDNDQYVIAKEYPGETPSKRNPNFVPSFASGGRVGLAEGSDDMILPMEKPETEKFLTREEAEARDPQMFVDTTTSAYGAAVPEGTPTLEKVFELEVAEIAKVILGTRGSPREKGEVQDTETMSSKDFMKNAYLIPKVKKLSENYGYSEAEILKMIKDEMMTYSKPKKEMMNKGGIMRLNYMIGGEAKQMEAGAPPIMYSGNMDPNAQNQQAGLPAVPGPMQMAEDGPEFDMRENGGFQPLGRQEGKDDVPAMLAKNEFVMTADAVRAAGGGSIQKGAQKMYDTMKKLESRVS